MQLLKLSLIGVNVCEREFFLSQTLNHAQNIERPAAGFASGLNVIQIMKRLECLAHLFGRDGLAVFDDGDSSGGRYVPEKDVAADIACPLSSWAKSIALLNRAAGEE